TRSSAVDRVAEGVVVRSDLHQVVQYCAGIAEEGILAHRRVFRKSSASSPRSASSRTIPDDFGRGCFLYCSRTSSNCWRMTSDREIPRAAAARVSSASMLGWRAIVVAFFRVSAMQVPLPPRGGGARGASRD